MKSFSSILLWLLLALLVAVPSFLFYNFVMKGKSQSAAETASAGPVANVFPPSQDKQPAAAQSRPAAPAVQPQAAAPAVQPQAAAQPAQAQPVDAPQQPAVQAAAAQPEPQPSASASAPETPAAPAEGGQQASAAPGQEVEVSTIPKPRSWYEPKSERDPTFSPADYRRLKDEQMQREEAERLARYAERNKPREPGPETRINLQGIVGNAALINNDMYYAGQTVRGIKILKVGTDYVIGECVTGACKGKKFKKVLK